MNPKILFIAVVIVMMALVSCGSSHGDTSIPLPEYISEITLDEDNNVTDMGRAGESTPDGNYYYHGLVRLYSEDGDSDTFDCYEGLVWKEDVVASYMAERPITLTEMIM